MMNSSLLMLPVTRQSSTERESEDAGGKQRYETGESPEMEKLIEANQDGRVARGERRDEKRGRDCQSSKLERLLLPGFLSVLALLLWDYAWGTRRLDITIESCARPAVELVLLVWSVVAIDMICRHSGLDIACAFTPHTSVRRVKGHGQDIELAPLLSAPEVSSPVSPLTTRPPSLSPPASQARDSLATVISSEERVTVRLEELVCSQAVCDNGATQHNDSENSTEGDSDNRPANDDPAKQITSHTRGRHLLMLASGLSLVYLLCSDSVQQLVWLDNHPLRQDEWAGFSLSYFLACFFSVCLLPWPVPLARERRAVARAIARTTLGFGCCSGPVRFCDVVVGDFLTSVSKGVGDLSICICTFVSAGGFSSTTEWQCIVSPFTPVACSLPFFWRFAQCVRSFRDTHKRRHLANAAKYMLGMSVVLCSSLKRNEMYGAPSAYYLLVMLNSIYCLYWDVAMDWGLTLVLLAPRLSVVCGRTRVTEGHGKVHASPACVDASLEVSPQDTNSPRQQHKRTWSPWVYRVAVVCDFILRVSWSFKLLVPQETQYKVIAKAMTGEEGVALAVALEVTRRTMWACLRLEWHLISAPSPQGDSSPSDSPGSKQATADEDIRQDTSRRRKGPCTMLSALGGEIELPSGVVEKHALLSA